MSDEHLWSTWLARAGLIPLLDEHVELQETRAGNSRAIINKIEIDKEGGAQTKSLTQKLLPLRT